MIPNKYWYTCLLQQDTQLITHTVIYTNKTHLRLRLASPYCWFSQSSQYNRNHNLWLRTCLLKCVRTWFRLSPLLGDPKSLTVSLTRKWLAPDKLYSGARRQWRVARGCATPLHHAAGAGSPDPVAWIHSDSLLVALIFFLKTDWAPRSSVDGSILDLVGVLVRSRSYACEGSECREWRVR